MTAPLCLTVLLPLILSLVLADGSTPPAEERSAPSVRADFWSGVNKDSEGVSPEDVLNFEIRAGDRAVFTLKVNKAPATIRAAYYVSAREGNKVVLTVLGPTGIALAIKNGVKEAFLHFPGESKGEYRFEFANRNVPSSC